MSCKSALYAANTSAQSLTAGNTINFGNAVRRFGCNCNVAGGNATITGSGYYDIDADITFTAGGVGTAVITLYKDGAAISGATASVTTAADTTYAVSVPAIVRQICCCESTITAVITGVAATVLNAAIAVEKI